uniref:Uncharacterized protein n=1 Tax=viral metagenome TaxID=1070528 RepID=A0A6M3LE14_9ZZZZ
MSTGIIICSKCKREMHQEGQKDVWGKFIWTHCEDKTPRCSEGEAVWPENECEIAGKFCGKDRGERGIDPLDGSNDWLKPAFRKGNMKKKEQKHMIKKSEYIALVGLLSLAKENNKQNMAILAGVLQITGETDEMSGHSGDAVYSTDITADQLLKKLKIKVRSF